MVVACDINNKKRDKFYSYLIKCLFRSEAILIPSKTEEFETVFLQYLEKKMKKTKHYRYYFGKFLEMFDFDSYEYFTPREMSLMGNDIADYNGSLQKVAGSIRCQKSIPLFKDYLIYNEYDLDYARKKQNLLRPYILMRDAHKCARCSDPHFLEIHHIQPISQYGKSTEDNLVTLCNTCHKEVHKFKDKKFLVG